MAYLDLILNLTLLVALSVVSGFVDKRWRRHTRLGILMQGFLFGSASLIGMLKPLVLGPGLIFDGRSVMLSLCALFFGPWAAVVAAPMPIVYRLWIGGAGARMGVLVVLSSLGIGLVAHSRLKPNENPPSARDLYLFGFVVHLAMVAMMFALPADIIFSTIFHIGPPVLLLYPLATILAGKILSDQVETLSLIEQLHSSQNFTNTILEHLPVGVAVNSVQPTVQFRYMNDNFARIYRTTREQLVDPDSFWTVVYEDPDFREQLRKRVLDDCASGDPERMHWMDIPITRKGEETIFITAQDIPIPGSPLVISTVWDVTDRKLAEIALRESEARFRLFAELAPVGIVISDSEQNTLYISHKFVEMFGYTIEEMPSVEHWWHLAYPDETLRTQARLQWNEAVDVAIQTRSEIKPIEFPVTCKNGTVREIEFRLASSGNLNVVLFTDISERKKGELERETLQSQLLQAQKMESVGRLAGGVAHDFNNMLMVITGHVQMALDQIDPKDAIHADLVEIRKAAEHSADLTRQLLAFARKQTIAPKVLDMNETVEGMLKVLRRLIGEDVSLAWLPEAGIWRVLMDPSQVDQILANLCVNARDAIAGVGKVTIETQNVVFDEDYCKSHIGYQTGEYVLLAVSDDGCGMSNPTLQDIFEPFFTTKKSGEGTGLGLATVYGIVKQNEGFINVYSELGKGTTFRIYLPRHAVDASDITLRELAEIPMGQGEIILLVEDERAILETTRKMLERLGYQIITASAPGEAIRLATSNTDKIQLLMTDVIMPDMNGRDLAIRVQEIVPNARCLFMSGYTADVIAHRGVLEEGVHFIEKPFSAENLAIKVREALGQ